MPSRREFLTDAHDLSKWTPDAIEGFEALHCERFKDDAYIIHEKHLTIGSQAWVLDWQQKRLICFAKETGAYTRNLEFFAAEPKKGPKGLVLFYVDSNSDGFVRNVAGADFRVLDWSGKLLYRIARQLTSLNRKWLVYGPGGDLWGEAHEGAGTSVARRIPFIQVLTVLSMEVHTAQGPVARFVRKRFSLGDCYELTISDPMADRRLLLALGVLFETIHD